MQDSRTNVLFINHSIRDGGPGKSLFYILKFIDRKRINPYVLIPKDDIFSDNLRSGNLYENVIVDRRFPENLFSPAFKSESLNRISENNFLVRKFLRFLYAVINIVMMIHLVLTSRKIIKSNNIGIIYCNGTIAKVVGALMGYITGSSVIWHVRNIQQTRFLGAIINYLSGLDNVKKIICVSKATAEQFRNNRNKIRVIYNGLDPDVYNPESTEGVLREEFGIPEETIVIGSTGRLVPRKGYEQFIINTYRIFEQTGTENDFVFVIVGDTPHFFYMNYINELKKHIQDMGLEDKFIFTGYRKEVRPYLKDMDIFFIPSNYPDPFPRSVIEAMSYALPVVGFGIGGIAEAFENGRSGFLSDPGDYGDMMHNISNLVKDKELRKKMGREARERVCSRFKAVDISDEIQEVILEVAGAN